MDLQGFTTIDEVVGDEDENCDKDVRTNSTKSFSPNTAAEEIDYLNKIILDIEKDIELKDNDTNKPLPCLNIETELLIQTDNSIPQYKNKNTMDSSDNSISKICVNSNNVPYELENKIQLESFSKENKHSLDNEGIISDSCTSIPVANENSVLSINKTAVEAKSKEAGESGIKSNIESTDKTFVVDNSKKVNTDPINLQSDSYHIIMPTNHLTENNSDEEVNTNNYSTKSSQEKLVDQNLNAGQTLVTSLSDVEEVCAASENSKEEVSNLLPRRIKAEPLDKEMEEEVDFGDYFQDPAEDINFDEMCNIKSELDDSIFFTKYKEAVPMRDLAPVTKFEIPETLNVFVPKVHFKVEVGKRYSKEQVSAAFLMAQSSLASVINMDMFNNLDKTFPFVNVTHLQNLTPSEVCFSDHELIDKFFHKYGTNAKKWKKIFKKKKHKKIIHSDSPLETLHNKSHQELSSAEKRILEIKALKEKYREAMNRTLARSTEDKKSESDFFGFKSPGKSQTTKILKDKLSLTTEKSKKKHKHSSPSKKQKEISPKKQVETESSKIESGPLKKQVKADSLKKQIEIVSLEKPFQIGSSKKQIESDSLEAPLEIGFSSKQTEKYTNSSREIEIDSLEKQMEVDSLKSLPEKTSLTVSHKTNLIPNISDEMALLSYYNIKPCIVLLSKEMFPKWNPNPFKAAKLVKIDIPSHHLKRSKVSLSSSPSKGQKVSCGEEETSKKIGDEAKKKLKKRKDEEKKQDNLTKRNVSKKDKQLLESVCLNKVLPSDSEESYVSLDIGKENRKSKNSKSHKERERSVSLNSVSSRYSSVDDSDDSTFSSLTTEHQEKFRKEIKTVSKGKNPVLLNSKRAKKDRSLSHSSKYSLQSDSEDSVMSISAKKIKPQSKKCKDSVRDKCKVLSKDLLTLNQSQRKQRERSLSCSSTQSYQSAAADSFESNNQLDVCEELIIPKDQTEESAGLSKLTTMPSSVNCRTTQKEDSGKLSNVSSLVSEGDAEKHKIDPDIDTSCIQINKANLNDSKASDDFSDLLNDVSVKIKMKDFSFSSNEEEFSHFLSENRPSSSSFPDDEQGERDENITDSSKRDSGFHDLLHPSSDQKVISQNSITTDKAKLKTMTKKYSKKSDEDQKEHKNELLEHSDLESTKKVELMNDLCLLDKKEDRLIKSNDVSLQNKEGSSSSHSKEENKLPKNIAQNRKNLEIKKCSIILEDLYYNKLYRKKIKKEKKFIAKSKENNSTDRQVLVFGSSKISKSKPKEEKETKNNESESRPKEEKETKKNESESKPKEEKETKKNKLESKPKEEKETKKNESDNNKKEINKVSLQKSVKEILESKKMEKKKKLTEVPLVFGSSFKIPKKSNKENPDGKPKSLIQRSVGQTSSYYRKQNRRNDGFDRPSFKDNLDTTKKSSYGKEPMTIKGFEDKSSHDAPKIFLNFNPQLMLESKENENHKERKKFDNIPTSSRLGDRSFRSSSRECEIEHPSFSKNNQHTFYERNRNAFNQSEVDYSSSLKSHRLASADRNISIKSEVNYPQIRMQSQTIVDRHIPGLSEVEYHSHLKSQSVSDPRQFETKYPQLKNENQTVTARNTDRHLSVAEHSPLLKCQRQPIMDRNAHLLLAKQTNLSEEDMVKFSASPRLKKAHDTDFESHNPRNIENSPSLTIKRERDFPPDHFESDNIVDSPIDLHSTSSPHSVTSSSYETQKTELQMCSDNILQDAPESCSPNTSSICERTLDFETQPNDDSSLEFIQKIESLDKKGKLKLYIRYKELYNNAKKKFHNEPGDINRSSAKLKRYKELNMRRKLYYDLKWYLYEQKKQKHLAKKVEEKSIINIERDEIMKSLNQEEAYSPSSSPILSESSQTLKNSHSEESYSPSKFSSVPVNKSDSNKNNLICSESNIDISVTDETEPKEPKLQNLKDEMPKNEKIIENFSLNEEIRSKATETLEKDENTKEILNLLEVLKSKEPLISEAFSSHQKITNEKLRQIGLLLQNSTLCKNTLVKQNNLASQNSTKIGEVSICEERESQNSPKGMEVPINEEIKSPNSTKMKEISTDEEVNSQKKTRERDENIKEILNTLQILKSEEMSENKFSPSQKIAYEKIKEIGLLLENLDSNKSSKEFVLQKINEIGVVLKALSTKTVECTSTSVTDIAFEDKGDIPVESVLQDMKTKEVPESTCVYPEEIEKETNYDIPSSPGSPILPVDVTSSFLTNRFELNEVLQNFEEAPGKCVPESQSPIEVKSVDTPLDNPEKKTVPVVLTDTPRIEQSDNNLVSNNSEESNILFSDSEKSMSVVSTPQLASNSDESMMKLFLGDTYKEDLLKFKGKNHTPPLLPNSLPVSEDKANPVDNCSNSLISSSLNNGIQFPVVVSNSAPQSKYSLPFPAVQVIPAVPRPYLSASDKPKILGIIEETVETPKLNDSQGKHIMTKESNASNLGISLATALLLPPPPPPPPPTMEQTLHELPKTCVNNASKSSKKGIFSSIISDFFDSWEDPLKKRQSDANSLPDKNVQKEDFEILFSNVRKNEFQHMEEILYEKVSLAQPLIEKVEGVPLVGLQLILEVQKEDEPSLENCSYICSLCSKKMSSATLIAHIKSVPHRLKYTECFSDELHEKFGKMEVKQWTAALVREFTLALQELEKKVGRQKIAVCYEKAMNNAVNHMKNKINTLLKKEDDTPQVTAASVTAPAAAPVTVSKASPVMPSKKGLPDNYKVGPKSKMASSSPASASPADAKSSPSRSNKSSPLVKASSPKQQKRPLEVSEKPGPKFTKSAQYKSRERENRDPSRDHRDRRDKNRDVRDKDKERDHRDKLPSRERDRDSRSKSRRKDSPHRRVRSRSPRHFSPHKKSRTRSPPFRSDRGGRKDNSSAISVEERKLKDFRADENRVKNEHFKLVDHYIKDPESHPRYKLEWERFWDRRYREVKQQGHNTDFYDFRSDWLDFWPKRLREICAHEFKTRREEMLARYRIPDPDPPSKVLNYFSIETIPKDDDFRKSSLERRPEDSRASSRDRFDMYGKKESSTSKRYQSRREKSPSPWEKNVLSKFEPNLAKDPYEVGFSVVGTLKLLGELEDQLGSLAPASKTLLKKAIEVTEKGGKPVDLFEDNDNLVLLRLVNVKFSSLIASGILDVMTAAKTQRAIESTNWIMKEAEKFAPQIQPSARIASLGLDLNLISTATIGMNTVQIAQYIAEQLFNIGKSDVDESVLQDILIAVSEKHTRFKLQSETSTSATIATNSSYVPPNNQRMTSVPPFVPQTKMENVPSRQGIASQNYPNSNSYIPPNNQGNMSSFIHSTNKGSVSKATSQKNSQRVPFAQPGDQENTQRLPFFQQNQGYNGPRPVAAPKNNDYNQSRPSFSSVPALFPSGAQSAPEVKKDLNENSSTVNTDRLDEEKGRNALSLLQSAYDNDEDGSKDKKEMDNLSLEELQGLLSNFRKLTPKEQQNLTDYLKRLEATDNKKVTKLRSMMHSSKPTTSHVKEQEMKPPKINPAQSFRSYVNKTKQDDLYDPLSPSVYEESGSSKRQASNILNKPKSYGADIPGKEGMYSPNVHEYYSTEKRGASNFPSHVQNAPGAEFYSNQTPDNFQRQPPFSGNFNENRSDARQPLLSDPNANSGFSTPRQSLLPEPSRESRFSRSRQPLLPKPGESEFSHARQSMPRESNRDSDFHHQRQSVSREPNSDYGFQNTLHEPTRELDFSGQRMNKAQEPTMRQNYPNTYPPLANEPKMDMGFSGSRQPLLQEPNVDSEFSRSRQPLLPQPNTDSRISGSRSSLIMDSPRDQLHSNPRQPLLTEPRSSSDSGMQKPQSSMHAGSFNESRYHSDGFRSNNRSALLQNPSKESGFFSDEFQTKSTGSRFPDESNQYSNRYQSEDQNTFYSDDNDPSYSSSRKTLLPDPSSERGFNSEEYQFDRNSENNSRSRDMTDRPPFGLSTSTSNFSGNRFTDHEFSTSNFSRNRTNTGYDFMRNESLQDEDNRPTVFSEDLRSLSKTGGQFSAKHSNFSQPGENFQGSDRDGSESTNRFSSGFVSDSFRNFSSSGNQPPSKNFETFGSNAGPSGPSNSYYDSFRQGSSTEDVSDQRSFQNAPQRFSRGMGRRGRPNPR